LGDAVLELVVTGFLFANIRKPEGRLTAFRAALVNTQSISDAASKLGMNEYLLTLARRVAATRGARDRLFFANAFEALIGSLYLDSGYQPPKISCKKLFFHKADDVVANRTWQMQRASLRKSRKKRMHSPTYQISPVRGLTMGQDVYSRCFPSEARNSRRRGSLKQEAEQDAAQKALAAKAGKR